MTSLQVWRTFEPDSYYKTFLEHSKRPDGRGLSNFRPINIKVGTVTTAEGSATVRLGHTTVMCGIKAEIATPTLRHPDEGFIVPNVELYPCCSPMFKAGPPGEKAIGLSQFLKNVITSAEVLLPSDLCIAPNKRRPVSSTFTMYSDSIQLVDPTAEDEEQGSGEVTVVLLEDGSLCTIHKPGGHSIVSDFLDKFINLARKRVKLVNSAICKALAERKV
ncbi:hypothetical protein O3P69_005832 [Scylla paramamosain]|uniref:Ribosomal RNA-processing protein 43 n=1 Tax=Scylla paramamosain TaxID=85552 RepID=A0AAW0U8F3_SCYPA